MRRRAECSPLHPGRRRLIEKVFFPELRRQEGTSGPRRPASVNVAAVLPAHGEPVEEREVDSDGGAHLQAVVLPARSDALEEREETGDVVPLQAAFFPETEECEKSDRGPCTALLARGKPVDKGEESGDGSAPACPSLPRRTWVRCCRCLTCFYPILATTATRSSWKSVKLCSRLPRKAARTR